jgi:phosphoribosylanthranilate isomerase
MIAQIYEIQTPKEAEACIALGVNRIGSVLLSEASWKQPMIREVIRVSEETKTENSLIPLFRERDTLYKAMEYYQPHYVHFCDSLTDDRGCEMDLDELIHLQLDLRKKFPEIGIIRSIPIPANEALPNFPTLQIAHEMESSSDLFLIDTWLGKEPVKGFVGITGRMADWKMAQELVRQSDIPVLLAGGLSPENVYNAILKVIPAGADSCTHTNQVDEKGHPIRFKKDFKKVEAFVKEVQRAQEAIRLKKEALDIKAAKLREELREREAALPAHSVRPHQIMAIETLEEEIALIESELKPFNKAA